MKKRLISLLLAAALSASLLTLPAQAGFSDVTDSYLSSAVESLRLMGVMGGYGDGTFRPSSVLTRAQFCKMAVYAMDGSGKLGQYQGITIFPDVKPSHWAAAYINMAAKLRIGDSESGQAIIGGYADGYFRPDERVTAGQAVTILLRMLGYTNADMSGVWPVSQMALGKTAGLTDGVDLPNGNAPLTRAQAAELFVNLLRCKTKSGGTLYTLEEKSTLVGLDGTGTMKTSGKTYTMVRTVSSSSLTGTQGNVLLNDQGKALTFLPLGGGNTGAAASAVIIGRDGSTAGLSALVGGGSYTLYKNGLPATTSDLRKDDVASASGGRTVQVCDTRVIAYYEKCYPGPEAPATIEVFGGTTLSVLPTARDSLAKFKPGDSLLLLLTADGQVASAVKPNDGVQANAMAVVSGDGTLRLICGNLEIELKEKAEEAQYFGQVMQISAAQDGQLGLYKLSNTSEALNVAARTLGSRKLADNALIYRNGERVALSQLEAATVPGKEILYARTNWAGNVDLLVLGEEDTVYYGRIVLRPTTDAEGKTQWRTFIDCGGKQTVEFYAPSAAVSQGDFVRVVFKNKYLSTATVLAKHNRVPDSAWTDDLTVNAGGRTYTLTEDVPCYNLDTAEWITLEAARAYAGSCNLYVYGDIVRVLEVGG